MVMDRKEWEVISMIVWFDLFATIAMDFVWFARNKAVHHGIIFEAI